jgi:hypothetical protein
MLYLIYLREINRLGESIHVASLRSEILAKAPI